jgi:DNA-binding NtrC family response regulator
MTLKDMVLDYERRLIMAALSAADGHQRRAAEALGLLPTTLHEKMKRLGIPTATSARLVVTE